MQNHNPTSDLYVCERERAVHLMPEGVIVAEASREVNESERPPHSSSVPRRASYLRPQSLSRNSNQALFKGRSSRLMRTIASRRAEEALQAHDDQRGPATSLITRSIIASDTANLRGSSIDLLSAARHRFSPFVAPLFHYRTWTRWVPS